MNHVIISKWLEGLLSGVAMKPKALITVFLFALVLFPYHASGKGRANFFKLRERTCEGYMLTIYRGNSIDYRSSILIEFIDSLIQDHTRIKIQAELIRKNGSRFEIPVPLYSHVTDSGFMAYTYREHDPEAESPLDGTLIRLTEWAAQPGDKLYLRIHDDLRYPYLRERQVPIEKLGLQGNLSFPFLSVQRSGDHSGSLGAGISYTLRNVRAERMILNKIGLGINLSLLDFDASQKVEIGLGFVVSFPDDLFCMGAGKNLTVNRDSGYYFLGINLQVVKELIGL
jgi:hypothetical protein